MNDGSNIGIKYSVKDRAIAMQKLATDMKSDLDKAAAAIKRCTSENWKGQGASGTDEKIDKLKAEFYLFEEAVNDFAKCILDSGELWGETDAAAGTLAGNLKDTSSVTSI